MRGRAKVTHGQTGGGGSTCRRHLVRRRSENEERQRNWTGVRMLRAGMSGTNGAEGLNLRREAEQIHNQLPGVPIKVPVKD